MLKVTRIEQQQRIQTQLLQQLIGATMGSDDAGSLPDDVTLPLKTVADVNNLEVKLEDEGSFKMLVLANTFL